MQDEAVRILQDHVQSDSGGLPAGQARGKVILPCGTGKTRISLRIVEELTPAGNVSVVLCPSIALVAQIRREYLQHATGVINALAICSDKTAGYDPKKEYKRDTLKDPAVPAGDEVSGKMPVASPSQLAGESPPKLSRKKHLTGRYRLWYSSLSSKLAKPAKIAVSPATGYNCGEIQRPRPGRW